MRPGKAGAHILMVLLSSKEVCHFRKLVNFPRIVKGPLTNLVSNSSGEGLPNWSELIQATTLEVHDPSAALEEAIAILLGAHNKASTSTLAEKKHLFTDLIHPLAYQNA